MTRTWIEPTEKTNTVLYADHLAQKLTPRETVELNGVIYSRGWAVSYVGAPGMMQPLCIVDADEDLKAVLDDILNHEIPHEQW